MKSKHILIVDDEPRVAFFLSKALEHARHDCRVSIAHSGEEALELLNRSPVDLLVTDLRMPGISGLELMRWVRAASPQTCVILITAYGNDEVEAEARRLEAYRYITKPFNVDDFTKAVDEAFRDIAVSQPGLIVLSDESFEKVNRELEALRNEVGARCIFLADMLGQRLAEVGVATGIDSATVLSLLAGAFATTGELARHFDSDKALNLNVHEGSRYEIYSANAGDSLFLAMLFDRKGKASRIGLVWLYTRRTIENLLAILSATDATTAAQPLHEEFGASLMTELDVLFPGSPEQGAAEEAATLRPRREEASPGPLSAAPAPPRPAPRPAAPSEESPAKEPVPAPAFPFAGSGGASPPSTPPPGDQPEFPSAEYQAWTESGTGEELLSIEDAIARGLIPPIPDQET